MQLTSTTDEAIQILCLLAGSAQLMNADSVSRELGVPVPYVRTIMCGLKRSQLVDSRMGANGGYVLARSPEDITMLDVVSATETTFNVGRGKRQTNDSLPYLRALDRAYQTLQESVEEYMDSVSIQDILDGNV